MAELETVAAGVFEEGGVVGVIILPGGCFEMQRARAFGDAGETIQLGNALHPEGDAVFIRRISGQIP